jgi:hypothetical protein
MIRSNKVPKVGSTKKSRGVSSNPSPPSISEAFETATKEDWDWYIKAEDKLHRSYGLGFLDESQENEDLKNILNSIQRKRNLYTLSDKIFESIRRVCVLQDHIKTEIQLLNEKLLEQKDEMDDKDWASYLAIREEFMNRYDDWCAMGELMGLLEEHGYDLGDFHNLDEIERFIELNGWINHIK